MDDFNNRGMSLARRRAESMIRQILEKSELKQEQERHRQAATKTKRLRELRLAKEAAERESKGSEPVRQQKRRPR